MGMGNCQVILAVLPVSEDGMSLDRITLGHCTIAGAGPLKTSFTLLAAVLIGRYSLASLIFKKTNIRWCLGTFRH